MRQLALQMGVSLDGMVALPRPHEAESWGLQAEDPAMTEWKLDALRQVGLHLMGRATYEAMAAYWPSSDAPYAPVMNEIPKVVFSRTLERADWPESRIARGDLAAEITDLKGEPGGELVAYGGAAFAQSLVRLGLVDEYRLAVQPVALGQGLPLFSDLSAPLHLNLVEARSFATGAAIHVYRPLASGPDQEGAPMSTTIARDDLRSALDGGAVTVVDALPAEPYRRRHLPGALNLVIDEVEERGRLLLPAPDASIVTYSTDAVCGRGEALAERLEELGYSDVRVYRDGIEDWVAAGLPVESSGA